MFLFYSKEGIKSLLFLYIINFDSYTRERNLCHF